MEPQWKLVDWRFELVTQTDSTIFHFVIENDSSESDWTREEKRIEATTRHNKSNHPKKESREGWETENDSLEWYGGEDMLLDRIEIRFYNH